MSPQGLYCEPLPGPAKVVAVASRTDVREIGEHLRNDEDCHRLFAADFLDHRLNGRSGCFRRQELFVLQTKIRYRQARGLRFPCSQFSVERTPGLAMRRSARSAAESRAGKNARIKRELQAALSQWNPAIE